MGQQQSPVLVNNNFLKDVFGFDGGKMYTPELYDLLTFCVCVSAQFKVVSNSLQPHRLGPARLLCLWDSPGKNNGVGCHFFLQGIFPTRGLNPGLPNHRQIL